METMLILLQFRPVNFSAIEQRHLALALLCYVVVFLTLFLLAAFFTLIPKLLTGFKKQQPCTGTPEACAELRNTTTIPGETGAAIAMAISLYLNELHDQENTVLTIRKVGKSYSPWSSKIYNVINFKRV